MKRFSLFLLIVCFLLCACSTPAQQTEPFSSDTTQTTNITSEPTAEPTTETTMEATTEPTTEPITEPPVIYTNPLNGEALDTPYTGRIIASTIDNVPAALPHHGISQADMFFEMFVNDYCTRGLALFSNAAGVDSIGPLRSVRYNFTDICLGYNAVLNYASGSPGPLNYLYKSGLDNISIDEANYGYRDSYRYRTQDYNWEHTLFATGQALIDGAQDRGFSISIADQDFGLTFSENATPANGQPASEIEIVFTHKGHEKVSCLKYDVERDKYIFWQYGSEMIDENNGEPEAFQNVIVILATVENDGVYHVADLHGSGDGYFACGGKLVPIRWIHENQADPLSFTLNNGAPLILGIGSTYVAVAPNQSPVNIS